MQGKSGLYAYGQTLASQQILQRFINQQPPKT
jgi:hypothetical protein